MDQESYYALSDVVSPGVQYIYNNVLDHDWVRGTEQWESTDLTECKSKVPCFHFRDDRDRTGDRLVALEVRGKKLGSLLWGTSCFELCADAEVLAIAQDYGLPKECCVPVKTVRRGKVSTDPSSNFWRLLLPMYDCLDYEKSGFEIIEKCKECDLLFARKSQNGLYFDCTNIKSDLFRVAEYPFYVFASRRIVERLVNGKIAPIAIAHIENLLFEDLGD